MDIEYPHLPEQSNWSGGLCNWRKDVNTSCITCCLPCITFGQIAETVDEGRSSCVSKAIVYGLFYIIQCHWFYSCLYRAKIRKKFGLPEEPCCDCFVHFCCEPCALCQEHAELKHRGFDPSKGWIGLPTVPPRMPPTMFK